ncbi:right-handed parallel beta-helix repeat-containing protein [Arcicella rosea]|uniref:Right handed beta helix region n=1 Tax=Arcicella rosea TaxID=502909 RepID=A0A841EP77_9BACT|nr:right-handed parallel beta-helix repeat-containing protein [Arcicella rosea]MBB6005045.1 hypothetical protein [Arcicella rosea]
MSNYLDTGFTISQLRLLSDSEVTTTQLFYCSEAGKEGFWKYNPSNTTGTDNVGTLLVTTGGKRLERVVDENILFTWFEVSGETDHTSTLNNAILAAKLLQKSLILKANASITVNQKFELYQSLIGNNSTIYLKNNSTIANGDSILAIMNHNITVSGIILDGNNTNNIGTATNGILGINAYQKKYLTIDNVKIINTRNRGLTIQNCPNFKFTNSIVDNCGRYTSQMPNPQADRISVLIDNNVATKGTEFYMGLESYIDNIKVTNSGLDGLVLGVGMNILNSTFSYNGQDLLNYYDGGAGIYTRPPQNYNNGEIDGLNIINCNTHWNTGLGIDIGFNAFSTNNPIGKNIIIQNCKASNNNLEGIGIGSNQDVSVLGNFCWDNGIRAFFFDGNVNSRRSGICLNSVPIVNALTSYFPTKNILIENNTCYDSRDVTVNKTQQYGIYIDNNHELAESENFIIKNNHLTRNAQKAILLPYNKRPVKLGSIFYFSDNTSENSFTISPQDNTVITPVNPHIYI